MGEDLNVRVGSRLQVVESRRESYKLYYFTASLITETEKSMDSENLEGLGHINIL